MKMKKTLLAAVLVLAGAVRAQAGSFYDLQQHVSSATLRMAGIFKMYSDNVNGALKITLDGISGTGTFAGAGTNYSIATSSGINVQAGGVYAPFFKAVTGFFGNLVGEVTGAASSNVLKAGDTMSGALGMTSGGIMTLTGAAIKTTTIDFAVAVGTTPGSTSNGAGVTLTAGNSGNSGDRDGGSLTFQAGSGHGFGIGGKINLHADGVAIDNAGATGGVGLSYRLSVSGNASVSSSMTASAFFGDASHLTAVSPAAFSISGNAGTATALAANGTNCSAGSFPLGVDASGNAESCTALSASNAGTATALAALGTPAGSGYLSRGIDVSGNALPALVDATMGGVASSTSPASAGALFASQALDAKLTGATFTGAVSHTNASQTLTGSGGFVTSASSVNASAFFGNGGALDHVLTTDGSNTVTSGSSVTVTALYGGIEHAYEVPTAKGNSGTTMTIYFTTSTVQSVTLNNNVTFTFAGVIAGRSLTLFLTQDGTGSRTVTWPTVKWAANTAPTLTTTASKTDVVSFYYDGSSYWGFVGGQNY